jgi:hypothetical protein
VAKKQRNCDPDDPDDVNRGDAWDFVAYDPEHRLVLAVIPGARSAENAEAIVAEVKRRLGGKAPDLITTDELPAYKAAIEATFSEPVPTPPRRGPGRPRVLPERRLPDGLNYATVHKNRENDRVGLGGPRGDDVPDDVRLHLLLDGADLASQGRRAEVEGADASDVGRNDRSSMDLARVVYPSGGSISLGHHRSIWFVHLSHTDAVAYWDRCLLPPSAPATTVPRSPW